MTFSRQSAQVSLAPLVVVVFLFFCVFFGGGASFATPNLQPQYPNDCKIDPTTPHGGAGYFWLLEAQIHHLDGSHARAHPHRLADSSARLDSTEGPPLFGFSFEHDLAWSSKYPTTPFSFCLCHCLQSPHLNDPFSLK